MLKGLVIKNTGSWYRVKTLDGETINCKIRGVFRLQGIKSTNPVAVGDHVIFEKTDSETGIITNIEERKNYIIRKSTNLSKQSHIIAANIDQAILVVTLSFPETQLMFIDRFLVTAEAYRIPAIIIFNKIDLFDQSLIEKHYYYKKIYTDIGYKCLDISALNDFNIEELKNILKDNVSLISGNSGVGKSLMVNKVDTSIKQKVVEVSDSHQLGKHTTTFAEMFELSFGGYIIDTPGIKGFGLHDIKKEEIYHFFPEIFNAAKDCNYNNCIHNGEPGCNVIKLVESNIISEERYYNYISLINSEDTKYRT